MKKILAAGALSFAALAGSVAVAGSAHADPYEVVCVQHTFPNGTQTPEVCVPLIVPIPPQP